MIDAITKKKWRNHCNNCFNKGVRHLTLDEYAQKLEEAGITAAKVGLTRGSWQLARYTDQGDYTPTSCRFLTKEENFAEMLKNGGRARAAATKTGRTKLTHPGLAEMAKKKSKPFSFKSPDGVVHSGENLAQFCKDRGLNQGNMWMVLTGRKASNCGWTRG